MKKGVYCIEGLWNSKNMSDKSTVLPILELLEKCNYCNYIFHDSATKTELEFYIGKWKNKVINDKYPILYLAFHGTENCITLSDNTEFTLDDLAELLGEKCVGKVIYFGSCSTLNINKSIITKFIQKTGVIAVIGYKNQIEWIQSTACDLFVLEALQHDKLDSRGIVKIRDKILSDYGNLHKILNLRIEINEKDHFPRSRIKSKD